MAQPIPQQEKICISDSETDYSDEQPANLPKDVSNALETITSRLHKLILHDCNPHLKTLLFSVDIMGQLHLILKCGYTKRNFTDLQAFSKGIMALQNNLNVFSPSGYKTDQKQIFLIIKKWDVI